MLFATDADEELKIPILQAPYYRTLREGRPARLRKCKVMVRVFDRVHWFLVTSRHSDDGAGNRSIGETMRFSWKGPVTVMRLERRGSNVPVGILSSEHHQAAASAIERHVSASWSYDDPGSPVSYSYLEVMSAELGRPDRGRWRTFIGDDQDESHRRGVQRSLVSLSL